MSYRILSNLRWLNCDHRSTIETLLEQGFKPTRGVVLTFGFDEEVSGLHGASSLAKYLLSTYGENAFFMLVDEGGK